MNTTALATDQVYRAYRLTLRGLRGSRAAARRQRAREIVTERYKLSHKELKDIVRKGDAAAGISHDHDPQYLEDRAYVEASEQLMEAFANTAGCPICENTNAEYVAVRVHPVAAEIEGVRDPYYSCFECYLEASYDI